MIKFASVEDGHDCGADGRRIILHAHSYLERATWVLSLLGN